MTTASFKEWEIFPFSIFFARNALDIETKTSPQNKNKKQKIWTRADAIFFRKVSRNYVSQVPKINLTGARIAPLANGWQLSRRKNMMQGG